MSYTKKVAYNTFAQMVGKAVGMGISLVTVATLFRYLGVEGVGKYTTVFAFVAFFAVFADFGLQWTLLRELAVQKDKNKVFRNVFTLRLIVALAIHLISFGLVWLFDYPIDVKWGVGIITLSWFFTTMNTVFVGVFQSNYRLDLSVSTDVIGRAIIYVLILLGTRLDLGFSLILTAYVFGNIINFFANMLLARRYIEVGFGRDLSYWPTIFRQALPIGIVLIFQFIYFRIDSLMLSWMKGMVDVGIYGTAYKLLEVLETVPVMFLGASFPLITKYVVEKDRRLPEAFQKQFDFLSLIGFPIVVGTFVLAKPIIDLIGGRSGEFSDTATISFLGQPATSVTVLKILVFAIAMSFFSNLYSYLIVSMGKQKNMIVPTISFALINVVLNFALIPVFSYVGSSLATLVTEVVVLVVTIYIASRYITIPVRFSSFFKIVLCALLMGVVIYYLNSQGLSLFINIAVAVFVYIAAILLTRAIPLDLIRSIIKKEV